MIFVEFDKSFFVKKKYKFYGAWEDMLLYQILCCIWRLLMKFFFVVELMKFNIDEAFFDFIKKIESYLIII